MYLLEFLCMFLIKMYLVCTTSISKVRCNSVPSLENYTRIALVYIRKCRGTAVSRCGGKRTTKNKNKKEEQTPDIVWSDGAAALLEM